MSKKIIIILFFLFLCSCDSKPKAEGLWNELCIIVSNEDKDLVYPYLSNILYRDVYTPTKEKEFKINWIDSSDFFKYKNYRSLIIVSLSSPADSTGDALREKFTSLSNKEIFSLNNTFSNNQLIVVLNVFDSIQLSNVLNENENWLYDQLNNHVHNTLIDFNSKHELNHDLVNKLVTDFNIVLDVDENYHLIKENKGFLWIGRGYPYRWIIVTEIEDDCDENNIFDIYRNSIHKNIDGLKITDTFKTIEYSTNYIKLSGLYEHEESDTGGPFFSYYFKNVIENKNIFVSGYVNNPGKRKYKLLKQLESIIINNKRINNEL